MIRTNDRGNKKNNLTNRRLRARKNQSSIVVHKKKNNISVTVAEVNLRNIL